MRRGFPRPRSITYNVPVPYTAEDVENVAVLHETRSDECRLHGLCAVCGLKLDATCMVVVQKFDHTISRSDHGLMHKKCGVIVNKFCPEFGRKRKNYLIEVDTEEMMCRINDERKVQVSYGFYAPPKLHVTTINVLSMDLTDML